MDRYGNYSQGNQSDQGQPHHQHHHQGQSNQHAPPNQYSQGQGQNQYSNPGQYNNPVQYNQSQGQSQNQYSQVPGQGQFSDPGQYSHGQGQDQYGRPISYNRPSLRKKSLLIGINYTGQKSALQGCQQDVRNMSQFLGTRNYPTDPHSQVILTDAQSPSGPFYPSSRNILSAMSWLISEPNTQCFLHYSGHGGQVRDPDGDRDSGYDDTIVPVDYQQHGQLDSDTLHKHLISRLPSSSTLFVVFDCCHSGSCLELPYVYRTDSEGNVSLVDSVKQGMSLMSTASNLLQGGFSYNKVNDAKQLLSGAQSFFSGLKHRGDAPQQEGLAEEKFQENWKSEGRNAFMFSGCRDDQTSADANIGGSNVGAMSWALLETLHKKPGLTYVGVLQNTRQLLLGKYKQIPQLSVGIQGDLNQPLHI